MAIEHPKDCPEPHYPAALPSDAAQAPVAVIGSGWQLLYASREPLAAIVERHDLKIGAKLYAAPVAADVTVDAAQASEKNREAEISQLIDERDSFEHMGTALAEKVSELLDIEVGEWSNANNPIFRAIHAIEDRIAAAPVAPAAKTEVTDEMVSRFLGWRLPEDFAPDCGVSFKPLGHPNGWPVGTNLFTATQARAMLEHVLAGQHVAPAASAQATERTAPFANCSFRHCDLPGQCTAEGACHHPVRAAVPQSIATLTREQREAIEWAAGRAHVESLGKPTAGVEFQRWRVLSDLFRATAPHPMTPRSSAEEIDACFRRNLDLLIQNIIVSDKNEITWIAMECRGVLSSLSTDSARKGTADADR